MSFNEQPREFSVNKDNNTQDKSNPTDTHKRPYTKPEFSQYGDIKSLSKGVPGANFEGWYAGS